MKNYFQQRALVLALVALPAAAPAQRGDEAAPTTPKTAEVASTASASASTAPLPQEEKERVLTVPMKKTGHAKRLTPGERQEMREQIRQAAEDSGQAQTP